MADYENANFNMDVVFTIGLNNIRNGTANHYEIKMKKWKDWLDNHAARKGLTHRLFFTKIPRPPLFVWFCADGPKPSNYVCYEDKLGSYNARIKAFNDCNHPTKLVVSFKNDGHRSLKKRGDQHVWSAWSEKQKSNMLHLTDVERVSMLNRIVKFFKLNL